MNEWRERIQTDPMICHGKACIKGTRVMVSVILDNLASGETVDDVMQGYHLERDDIHAALHFAADLTRNRPGAVDETHIRIRTGLPGNSP